MSPHGGRFLGQLGQLFGDHPIALSQASRSPSRWWFRCGRPRLA
jgi:hypothetical protein